MGKRRGLSREMRRSLRFRRRLLLFILLVFAFSPTLGTLYLMQHSVFPVFLDKSGPITKALHPPDYPTDHLSVPQKVQSHDTSQSLQECSSSSDKPGVCCAPWSTNTDEWWTMHPDWLVVEENSTHTCFSRYTDQAQLEFINNLQKLQWQTDCTKGVQKAQISSGYAAALMATARSFYAAYKQSKPFQITKAHDKAIWNFSPRNPEHWAYCPTKDMNCYFLPLSSCPAELGRDDGDRGIKPSGGQAKLEFAWLRQYAFRPRHRLRRKLVEYMQEQQTPVTTPCAAIHVRRGDIAFGRGRRYAAVDEYLQAGNITKGETVVLLTDDVSTIEEVEKYHKNDYNWVYLNRARVRGSTGGFEGFIPSQDPALEVLAIMSEIKLASSCNKLVHGKSGFVAIIVEAMENSGHPFETIYLQTQQDKKQQAKLDPKDRAEIYLNAIQERLEKDKKEATI